MADKAWESECMLMGYRHMHDGKTTKTVCGIEYIEYMAGDGQFCPRCWEASNIRIEHGRMRIIELEKDVDRIMNRSFANVFGTLLLWVCGAVFATRVISRLLEFVFGVP